MKSDTQQPLRFQTLIQGLEDRGLGSEMQYLAEKLQKSQNLKSLSHFQKSNRKKLFFRRVCQSGVLVWSLEFKLKTNKQI